jgi:hypothetical protein
MQEQAYDENMLFGWPHIPWDEIDAVECAHSTELQDKTMHQWM